MKRQRNTAQMKEKTRNTQVQINEEEIGKLPEKEFRIMIVKMIKNFENKMTMQESCKSMADSCQCMAKPLQYCKVISLQLIKIKGEKWKESINRPRRTKE